MSASDQTTDTANCDQRNLAVFTYGTLQREDIQLRLFERHLTGQSDALVGYALRVVEIRDQASALTQQTQYPMLCRAPEAPAIDGMVYWLSEAELQRADHYEGPEYRRDLLTLQSGLQAWVYVDAAAPAT